MKNFYNKRSHKAGFAIFFLVLFAPFGIYLIFKNKHFKLKTRYIVSAVALVWMSFIIIDGQPTEEEIQAEEIAKEEKEAEREAKKDEKGKEKADKKQGKEDEEQAKIDVEEAEKREREKLEDEWKDYRSDLLDLDHYADASVLNIQTDKRFSVFYAIVPNEFKLSTEEEKQYYADDIGTLLEEDINAHFDDNAHVYFHYQDGNTMASRKMMGGWKIK